MSRTINLLDSAGIASPCPALWEEMRGDDRVRFCEVCQKNVFNLAEMSREAAEAIIIEHDGSLCGRLYQRTDGTVVRDNCPIGLKNARLRFARVMGGLAVVFALMMSGARVLGLNGYIPRRLRDAEPFKRVARWLAPPPKPIAPIPPGGAILGRIRVNWGPGAAPKPIVPNLTEAS